MSLRVLTSFNLVTARSDRADHQQRNTLMNTYLKVHWKHQFDEEPVLLYSELDSDRWENRKVEIFEDGPMVPAASGVRSGKTRLGEVPLPSIAEIAADPQFEPIEITAEEFEEIWKRANA